MPPEIDLRSDTVTRPCPQMLRAMTEAEVGDDVICVDPTVARLEAEVAHRLGFESALFMPSGTMANQIAIRCHCQPGDEFICEAECHIYRYEQGGFAQLSGLVPKLISGERGILQPTQLMGTVSPIDDHAMHTRLVTLENTHNRGGGTIQPVEVVEQIASWAREHDLKMHLDGARLFNAAVASGISVTEWTQHFDSVSVCFSKGLGAPVGSALAGSHDFIRRARRARKLFGGGMRQAGFLAAAALFALEHNVDRLAEDHAKAQQLAQAARDSVALDIDSNPQTNIVLIHIDATAGSAEDLVAGLKGCGVGAFPFGPQHVRLVTHKDVSNEQIAAACDAIRRVASRLAC